MTEKIRQSENKTKLNLLGHIFYRHFFVDVDSTLAGFLPEYGLPQELEGINLLASMQGPNVEKAVKEITDNAMGADMPFNIALEQRLKVILPKKKHLGKVARIYLDNIVPDALETFTLLKKMGVDISLLSGGFINMMGELAKRLNIPIDKVYANELFFDSTGEYIGYDKENLLAQEEGKKLQMEKLKKDQKITGTTAIIGDGTSELKTKPVADIVIGFGGFVKREKVMKGADIFLAEPTFRPLNLLLLDPQRIRRIIYKQPEDRYILQKTFDSIRSAKFNNRTKYLEKSINELYNEFAHFNY